MSVSTGTESVKVAQNAGVIVENKLALFYGSRCICLKCELSVIVIADNKTSLLHGGCCGM